MIGWVEFTQRLALENGEVKMKKWTALDILSLKFAFVFALLGPQSVFAKVIPEAEIDKLLTSINDAIIAKNIDEAYSYYAKDATLVIDIDPDKNKGKQKMPVDTARKLNKMAIAAINDLKVSYRIVAHSYLADSDITKVQVEYITSVSMMGMKSVDTSISTYQFKYIDGKIKILSQEDELIESNPSM